MQVGLPYFCEGDRGTNLCRIADICKNCRKVILGWGWDASPTAVLIGANGDEGETFLKCAGMVP